ncbi:MAG TPA: EVE domain-containing protein [Kofleriaceae bacterium]|nr:EVE domain-containing protein [Kofleriaceae bacterium]
MAKQYWLMKSEPESFGIDDLEQVGSSHWDGVRNYQARNFMKEMKVGDEVLFYHSNAKPPGVAGLATVSREAFPDFTAWDARSKYYDPKSPKSEPRWFMVELAFAEKFPALVPLDVLKETPGLEDMLVIRKGMRLSVQPVQKSEFTIVKKLGKRKPARSQSG